VFGRGEGKGEGRGPPRSGTTPTAYRYTGQRWEAGLGLYFYRARWYDPTLGRFVQPDTVVPDPANPQGLNRYAYARNSPLRYTDPTGHFWWAVGAAVGAVVGAVIGYGVQVYNNVASGMDLGSALTTNIDWKPIVGGAVGGAVVGSGVGLIAEAAAGAAAVEAGTAAATAACADGDCTNEVGAVVQTAQNAAQAVQSVWQLDPLQRGQELHRMLGANLPQNFPVIDRFVNGVATSIKTLDLNAATYQNIGALTSRVQGYINALANFQSATLGRWSIGTPTNPITGRVLELAIPPGATPAQLAALQQLQQYAANLGVTLNIVVVP